MRARTVALLLSVAATACGSEPAPPVVEASEVKATASPSASADPDEARLAELRATDAFDEFAEHQRAAQADGARLAWENFAPIVDGRRVEWTNKAELWDSIAPKIRDEALLLGPEHRKPLWNNRNAVPASLAMAWDHRDTSGRGHYVEFRAAVLWADGPGERIWGALVATTSDGRGQISARMPPLSVRERAFATAADAFDHIQAVSWEWVSSQSGGDDAA